MAGPGLTLSEPMLHESAIRSAPCGWKLLTRLSLLLSLGCAVLLCCVAYTNGGGRPQLAVQDPTITSAAQYMQWLQPAKALRIRPPQAVASPNAPTLDVRKLLTDDLAAAAVNAEPKAPSKDTSAIPFPFTSALREDNDLIESKRALLNAAMERTLAEQKTQAAAEKRFVDRQAAVIEMKTDQTQNIIQTFEEVDKAKKMIYGNIDRETKAAEAKIRETVGKKAQEAKDVEQTIDKLGKTDVTNDQAKKIDASINAWIDQFE